MVASTCVLPQEPFPVATLDYSHKRHNSLSSLKNWNDRNNNNHNNNNINPKMANYTLSSNSISSSSRQSSPKSVASVTPSMSPSSIISSQRANRQEKKHHTIHSTSAPSSKGQNRSALVYTSSQPPSPSTPSPSRSGAQGTPKSLKRITVWASSVRKALSSSSSHPIHGSCKSTPTPSSKQQSTASTTSEYSNHHNFNSNKSLEGTEPLTNVTSKKSSATSSSSSSPPLLYSSSFEPRSRLLSQGTRRKIGAGLITAFCIAAIVVLVLC
ncbi:hypothetical protein MVEG_04744 [Podila verticillata NRRL 6337]|nr:hypothetical protein MVEG_04744 [Podila verticillata NRRL 6337]